MTDNRRGGNTLYNTACQSTEASNKLLDAATSFLLHSPAASGDSISTPYPHTSFLTLSVKLGVWGISEEKHCNDLMIRH